MKILESLTLAFWLVVGPAAFGGDTHLIQVLDVLVKSGIGAAQDAGIQSISVELSLVNGATAGSSALWLRGQTIPSLLRNKRGVRFLERYEPKALANEANQDRLTKEGDGWTETGRADATGRSKHGIVVSEILTTPQSTDGLIVLRVIDASSARMLYCDAEVFSIDASSAHALAVTPGAGASITPAWKESSRVAQSLFQQARRSFPQPRSPSVAVSFFEGSISPATQSAAAFLSAAFDQAFVAGNATVYDRRMLTIMLQEAKLGISMDGIKAAQTAAQIKTAGADGTKNEMLQVKVLNMAPGSRGELVAFEQVQLPSSALGRNATRDDSVTGLLDKYDRSGRIGTQDNLRFSAKVASADPLITPSIAAFMFKGGEEQTHRYIKVTDPRRFDNTTERDREISFHFDHDRFISNTGLSVVSCLRVFEPKLVNVANGNNEKFQGAILQTLFRGFFIDFNDIPEAARRGKSPNSVSAFIGLLNQISLQLGDAYSLRRGGEETYDLWREVVVGTRSDNSANPSVADKIIDRWPEREGRVQTKTWSKEDGVDVSLTIDYRIDTQWTGAYPDVLGVTLDITPIKDLIYRRK